MHIHAFLYGDLETIETHELGTDLQLDMLCDLLTFSKRLQF